MLLRRLQVAPFRIQQLLVFKRLDAPYTPGRPNFGGSQFKYKLCATASFIVSGVNTKRSV